MLGSLQCLHVGTSQKLFHQRCAESSYRTEFTEVGPTPRLCLLPCQGSRGVEWPGRPLEEGWGICFLIKMLWETGFPAPGFQEEMSLGPNGKEKGTKDYLLLGRKPESSSISNKSVAHTQRRGTLAAPQKPIGTRRQQAKSVSLNPFFGLPKHDTGSWFIASVLSCPESLLI